MSQLENIATSSETPISAEKKRQEWHALWTRSHCEALVRDQLAAKGFHPFIPTLATWTIRGGKPRATKAPMFPGYLFLPDHLDKHAYIEVRKSRGLVALLGESWDRLAVIPEKQIESIGLLQDSAVSATPHPYWTAGRRVRVIRGPLAGAEGFLLQVKSNRGRLVISVELLQRSVSAEVDCSAVVAV